MLTLVWMLRNIFYIGYLGGLVSYIVKSTPPINRILEGFAEGIWNEGVKEWGLGFGAIVRVLSGKMLGLGWKCGEEWGKMCGLWCRWECGWVLLREYDSADFVV